MKKLITRLSLIAAFAAVALFGRTTNLSAQDSRPESGDRLDRMERRVTEMAGNQEKFMHQVATQMEKVGAQMERLAQMRQPGGEQMRPLMQPAGSPGGSPQHPQEPKVGKKIADTLGLLCFIGFICNILMAIWIYTDIRKRGEGSAIFIAMAVVAGIPAAIIYALTRIGDRKA